MISTMETILALLCNFNLNDIWFFWTMDFKINIIIYPTLNINYKKLKKLNKATHFISIAKWYVKLKLQLCTYDFLQFLKIFD